jgi:hypothetical protein
MHTPKLKRSKSLEHSPAKAEVVKPRREEGQFTPNGYEIPLAIALGRFQELCRGLAFEHDVPERLFAQRLAELVYRSQVR